MRTQTHVLGLFHSFRTRLGAYALQAGSRSARLRPSGGRRHGGRWLPVLLVGLALTLGGSLGHAGEPLALDTEYSAAPSSSTGPSVEYSFYQPAYVGGTYYYWAAYLGLWSTGQFKLIMRTEVQYPGAVYQCDRVDVLILYGNHYTNSNGHLTFPGSGTDALTDNCTPSLNQQHAVTETLDWAYTAYNGSPTALLMTNAADAPPFNRWVLLKCIPGTNCQQHYK
jgi:hypothetical protein